GFDESFVRVGHWVGKGDQRVYLANKLTDDTIDFITRHQDEPFAVTLAHYVVHIPLQAEADLINHYQAKPKPSKGVNNPIYAAMVAHADRSVGRVLKTIDDLKLREKTLVVFYSDNGGLRQIFHGDGPIVSTNDPLHDEKGTLYEGGIRVPLIVRWPGVVKPGQTSDAVVTSVDLYPTFLEATGAQPPKDQHLDGLSLLPVLRQSTKLKRDAIYWHYPHYHHSRPGGAIRSGDWKLIEFFDDPQAVELYNLAEDTGEANNLAAEKPQQVAALKAKLSTWRAKVNAAMPTPNPDYDPARKATWGHHPDRPVKKN
ncbi:MAG: sulfatase-like hydrolase/transferase, partial [Firmicutes bacterium]|nr:sulfatase-like hydrolase/transferase [Bacillota bacterium]